MTSKPPGNCHSIVKSESLIVFHASYPSISQLSTFTPQLPRLIPPRQVTTDDLERDRVLAQRIALFGWIEEKHLDVPEEDGSKGFLMFAQQGKRSSSARRPVTDRPPELLKVNHYKAPRDKLICILNCCKVIFGPKYLLSRFPSLVAVWLTTTFLSLRFSFARF